MNATNSDRTLDRSVMNANMRCVKKARPVGKIPLSRVNKVKKGLKVEKRRVFKALVGGLFYFCHLSESKLSILACVTDQIWAYADTDLQREALGDGGQVVECACGLDNDDLRAWLRVSGVSVQAR